MWKTLTTLLVSAFLAPASPSTPPGPAPPAAAAGERAVAAWTAVARGLDYRRIEHRASPLVRPVVVHAFRFSPERYELRVLPAGSGGERVERLARAAGALLAVNGGFFLEDFTPLGLLVSEGRQLNPLRKADWGVFSIARGEAAVTHRRAWKRPPGLEFAIEAGPRLVVDGEVLSLKPQRARRTALGVTDGGDVVVVATEGHLLTSHLAELFQRPVAAGGLGCPDALNLDGGSSTQLWFEHGGRRIEVEPLAKVANAVALFPR